MVADETAARRIQKYEITGACHGGANDALRELAVFSGEEPIE